MKNFIKIPLVAFLALLIYSCSPTYGYPEDETTTPPVISNKVVSKMFSHSKNEDTGEWEDETLIYKYENKLLKSIESSENGTLNFEYNTNKKISKITSTSLVATLEYNANKQLSKINIKVLGFSENTTTFTYDSAGKVVKMSDVMNSTLGPLPISIGREDNLTYSGTKVMKCVSVYRGISSGASVPANVTATFEYDNKISPFSTLPFEYNQFNASLAGAASFMFSKNNLTKSVTISDITDTSTITYQYDSEGYAIKGTNGEEYGAFEYIKL